MNFKVGEIIHLAFSQRKKIDKTEKKKNKNVRIKDSYQKINVSMDLTRQDQTSCSCDVLEQNIRQAAVLLYR